MKVLFIGDAWLGSNARSLADGCRGAGHDVLQIDTTPLNKPARYSPRWAYSKIAGRRYPGDREVIHSMIQQAVSEWRPDVVIAFKTIHLDQARLAAALAHTRSVHYSADDVTNTDNTTPDYLAHEKDWDLIVTTKRHNLTELEARGVVDPLFVYSAYDPSLHFRAARLKLVPSFIGFIGNYRPDRSQIMAELGAQFGRELVVRGPGWTAATELRKTDALVLPGAYGPDFSRAVASISANLVLLNSENRDTHTCRTFEVPAAGGLFVGERTNEHSELIDDGTSGYLFSDIEELREVLARLVREPDQGRKAAELGYRSIVNGGHSYTDRARAILARVRDL